MRRQSVTRKPVPLDAFGDVLTNEDVCAVLGKGPRHMERLITLERKTQTRCTPETIPGYESHRRYHKDAVRRWLKVGAPQLANARESRAA